MTAHAIYRCVVGALPPTVRRHLFFLRRHGRFGRFRHPRSFNEKVNWRLLHDRRDALSWTCDKLAMKEHVRRACPDLHVPETFWFGTDVAELTGRPLPPAWVLKPNHRTAVVRFGAGPVRDVEQLRRDTSGWLDDVHGTFFAEWAYSRARPLLLVEDRVGRPDTVPDDFKFFVFDGVPRLIQMDVGRFDHHTRNLYRPDWQPLDIEWAYPAGAPVGRPSGLDEMLEVASRLGAGYDFLRVDLYCVDGTVSFGELSPYPGAGLERLRPRSFDVELGSYWTLPQQPAS